MRQETAKVLEDGAKALTLTTGVGTSAGSWLGFLNNNAPAIGILLTLIFGILTIYFQRKQVISDKKLDELKSSNEALQKRLEEMEKRGVL